MNEYVIVPNTPISIEITFFSDPFQDKNPHVIFSALWRLTKSYA